MSEKQPSHSFAEGFSIGITSLICSIGAASAVSQNLLLAGLCGIAGFALGILALRTKPEKPEKIFAILGIILAFAPVVYLLIAGGRK